VYPGVGSAPVIQQRRFQNSASASVELMPAARSSGLKLLPDQMRRGARASLAHAA